MKRVVVTGCGVVSALGLSSDELFGNLLAGKSAVKAMPHWQKFFPNTPIAAPLDREAINVKSIDRKFRRSMGNVAIYALIAAQQAVESSGIDEDFLRSGAVGCAMGSTMGGVQDIEDAINIWGSDDRELMGAMQFFKCVSHTCALNVSFALGLKGVQFAPCCACSSALQAIGMAYETILLGKQKAMLAGGADELTPLVSASFNQLFALASDSKFAPEESSRPFDRDRSGLVCGEGAGVFMLEEYESAVARKAPILFEIIGYASNTSAVHISQSDSESIARCIRLALESAKISPAEVDYVNAHATGTPQGDFEEAKALNEIFGETTMTSSLKGYLGHTLAASGGIELAAIAMMCKHNKLLPNRNLSSLAEDMPKLGYLTTAVGRNIDIFVKNSFAFGGINVTLVGRKFKDKV